MTISPWELYYANFPLEEDPSIGIDRPVIVLHASEKNQEDVEVLSVKVTRHTPRDHDEFDIPIVEWSYAGLSDPSTARVAKSMVLSSSRFRRKIGVLHTTDQAKIAETYMNYIKSQMTE